MDTKQNKIKLSNIFSNSFKINSNPSNATVSYIVDPYDRKKDITCITPCKITIPWEPLRYKHNKDKLLVQKDGYESQIVKFKYGVKTLLKFFLFIAFLISYYFYIVYPKCFWGVLVFAFLYSVGSDDITVNLKKEKD